MVCSGWKPSFAGKMPALPESLFAGKSPLLTATSFTGKMPVFQKGWRRIALRGLTLAWPELLEAPV